MRADTPTANVVRTFVAFVHTCRAVGYVVVLTYTCSIASVGVSAVVRRGITASGTSGKIRMSTYPAAAHVVRTVIAVISACCAVSQAGMGADTTAAYIISTIVAFVGTCRTVGNVIVQADPESIARIRTGAIV